MAKPQDGLHSLCDEKDIKALEWFAWFGQRRYLTPPILKWFNLRVPHHYFINSKSKIEYDFNFMTVIFISFKNLLGVLCF